MPDTGNPLGPWVEKVNDELHSQDIRLTKIETTNRTLKAVLVILISIVALVIAALALK